MKHSKCTDNICRYVYPLSLTTEGGWGDCVHTPCMHVRTCILTLTIHAHTSMYPLTCEGTHTHVYTRHIIHLNTMCVYMMVCFWVYDTYVDAALGEAAARGSCTAPYTLHPTRVCRTAMVQHSDLTAFFFNTLKDFVDRWRYNAKRSSMAQSRLKAIEKL